MMSARWIITPCFVLLVLTTSWALAAKEEPGVAAAAEPADEASEAGEGATEKRSIPAGLPTLPFSMSWQPIVDELPQEIFDALPTTPLTAGAQAEASMGDDGDLDGLSKGLDRAGDKVVWESSLAAREQALARTQATLNREMKRSEEILARAEAKLEEARLIRHYAEKSCGGSLIAGGPIKGLLPPTPEELEANATAVADIVKKMKPNQAADMLQRWDEPLIIDVLKRLSARTSSPILGKMPADVSGRITSRMLTGEVSVRVGGAEK